MIGNPEECSDLGIARDALIDVAIRDGIDLADARAQTARPDLVQPQSAETWAQRRRC